MNKRIGVDADEVLWALLPDFIAHYNEKNETAFQLDQFISYNWELDTKVSQEELSKAYLEFHASGKGYDVRPMTDAYEVLSRLKTHYGIVPVLITARLETLEPEVVSLLNKHYPDIFETLHFSHKATGERLKKSELCALAEVDIMIDDLPHNARDCAESGCTVLLFGEYPWHADHTTPHDKIIPVKNWQAVEKEVHKYYGILS